MSNFLSLALDKVKLSLYACPCQEWRAEMFQTLAYYSSAFYKDFTDYAGSELQRLRTHKGVVR